MLDYFIEIEWFDTHLGQIIEILRETGELDNTLVLVTGDNGSPVPGGKSELYDLGTHVPLLAFWPDKIKPGRVVDDLVSQIDFAPTFLEDGRHRSTCCQITGKSFLDLLLVGIAGDSIRPGSTYWRPRKKAATRVMTTSATRCAPYARRNI